MPTEELLHAIIFIPARLPLDGIYVRQCVDHIHRRGYEFHTVVRSWADALAMVDGGFAQVIVLARREHLDPTWTPRIEFVGQTTRDLPRPEIVRDSTGRHRSGRNRRPNIL